MNRDALAALVVRSATDFAIVTCDTTGIITSWSPGAQAVMGWTEAEAVGQPVALFFTPEDVAADRPQAEMANARAAGCAVDERWHVKRDGTRFWASGELQPLAENGRTVGFVKILRDRTEHVALQEQLAAAQRQAMLANQQIAADGARLQQMFAAAPGFIAVLRGPDHVFDFANESYNRLVGHRPLIGRSVREALPEVEGQGFYELLDQVYASGERVTAAQQPIMLRNENDGALERRYVSFVYEPMRDPDGSVVGIFVEGIDGTDTAIAQANADKLSAERAAILGQLAEGVIATDAQGRISFVNAAAADLHGVARLGVGPDGYSEAYQLLTEDGTSFPSAELPLARAVARGEIVRDARWRIRRPDGSEVLAIGNAQPVVVDNERVGAVLTVRDDTERSRSEERVRRSEAELKLVLNASAGGFYAVDADGVTTLCSRNFLRLLGFHSEDEVLGRKLHDIIHHSHPDGSHYRAVDCPVHRAATSGESAHVADEVFFRRDGTPIAVEYWAEPIIRDGKRAGAVCTFVEISARKAAEAALVETGRRLDAVLNNTKMAIFMMDERQHCAFANAAAEVLTGYSFDEMRGRPLHDVIHNKYPDGRHYPLEQCPIDRAFPERSQMSGEELFVHKDGSFYPVEFTASPVLNEDGRPIGTVIEARNIAARKEAEAALRESEQRFRRIADSTPVPMWVTGADRTREFVNRAYVDFLGISYEEAVSFDWRSIVHPDEAERILAESLAGEASGKPFVLEARFRRSDGQYRWLRSQSQPRFTANRQVNGFIGVVNDVTEAKQAENALREETRALETLNRVFAEVAGELDLERVVQMVTDAGREITGAEFGAFFYNRVTDQGDMMLYTLSGVERSAFERFGMPRATAIFHPTLSGEGVVRSDDITQDPRYGLLAPHHGMPEGHIPVRSYLAVPVVSRSGESIGGLFYGHKEAGRFDARHERLLVGIAGQAATAIDNARLFEAAQQEIARRQKVEERREFLLQLGDRLRIARTAEDAKLAAAESLGRYIGAARAGYGEVDDKGEIVSVSEDWVSKPDVGSLAGESRILDGFGPQIVAELRAGRTLVVEDCMADPRAGETYAETWNSIGCRALVVVPLVRDDRLRALFYLHEPLPRHWTDEEIALADEVAERTWDAVGRARAEDALRASEARYRTLFEAIDAGFCILQMKFDEQGRAIDYRFDEINPAFERQTGLIDAKGRWIRDLSPDFEQHWVDLYGQVAKTREPARYENASEALGRWFDVYAFAIDGPDDGRVAVLFNDVSERKRAELQLTELNRTLEARVAQTVAERDMIWRTSQDLFVVGGLDGLYRSANPAWSDALGYRAEELIGLRFDALVHPDDARETGAEFSRLAAGNVVRGLDLRMRHANGSYRWYSWTCVPKGDIFYAAGRDVTERKELEEQLRQSQKMEAVGQLTGGIAHDFNNLLTIVSGNIDMAKRTLGPDGNPRALRSLGNAAKGADRAAALTQRLLAFSRRQPLQPRETDVNRLIIGMTELLDRALGETVDLQVVTGAGLWRVEVDPNQLENAILNLAVNARDAMPGGGKLTIETNNTAIDEAYASSQREVVPGQYVLVSVTDTGEGMPPDIVAKAFDPFFSTKEVGKGTGLGLSQVYGYVKQSGGHVKIYSEAGQGTTIKIYLPRLIAAMNGADEDAADAAPALQGMESILVVEDDDDVRIYTVDSLRELGYRVLEAHDAASALRLLERQDEAPRLLLTDVVMPGMSGRELADKARAAWPDMRVLFTTGYARNAIVHGGRLDPGVELLPKPFTYEALAAKIREVLEKNGNGRAIVLDPSDNNRSAAATALARLGFESEPAADIAEALGKLRAARGSYQVVLLSDALPVADLNALIAELHAVRHDLPILIVAEKDADRARSPHSDRPCVGVISRTRVEDGLEDQLTRLRVRCADAS